MPLRRWWERSRPVPGAPQVHGLGVTSEEWSAAAQDVAATGGRLLALWAAGETYSDAAYAAFMTPPGVLILKLNVTANLLEDFAYPSLAGLFPAAARMERAAFDLMGVRSSGEDRRPWLRHTAWSAQEFPLRPSPITHDGPVAADTYEFVRVQGEGVHEIPVGPVHAGIIEPGHFRFSVVGEKVLRLEERLGYTHKGIERRFTELTLLDGHRLAARVSGDSAVAFSWAYCQALEGLSNCSVPPRALWLRALFLELERITNHLGDLGALGNDAGFAFGLTQFSRLKETLLRTVAATFGARYLMDAVIPGGTVADLTPDRVSALVACIESIARESEELRRIYDDHAGVRDRFFEAGKLAPELAARLGVVGLAARASGQVLDARVDSPCAPYDELAVQKVVRPDGDVAARVAVRFEEIQESRRLIEQILARMPAGPHVADARTPAAGVPTAGACGVGWIEGWRGPVFVWLEAGAGGAIRRCHPHDPSWQNWPALEHAILDSIVPDFPLINKSFNLSYSGHDL